MLRKTLLLAVLALTMVGTLAASGSFDGGDPIPPCSPKTCPQGPGR